MRSRHVPSSFARKLRAMRILASIAFFLLIQAFPATIPGQATIEFGSAGGAGNFDSLGTRTSLTWSHTIAANTNRILIVGVSTTVNGLLGPNSNRVLSVTYAGQPLTLIGSRLSPLPGTRSSTEMFRLVAPPVGTANVVVTLVGTIGLNNYAVGGSASFSGVHQTTPHGSFVSGSGFNDSPTAPGVSSAANEVVIDNIATTPEAQFLADGAEQTERYNGQSFIGGLISVGAGSTEPGAGSIIMSWQSTSPGEWAIGAISLKPAPNPTSAPALISGQVTTSDGTPLSGVVMTMIGTEVRRTITDNNGRYLFVNVPTDGFYTLAPSRANYVFSPCDQSFALLGNKTDALFAAEPGVETANPLDTAEFFARQQYLDFLAREPDHDGWIFWADQINQCNGDLDCIRQRRVDVSTAFFLSEEFGRSGSSYIFRLYRAALGRRLTFSEYAADRRNVIGGQYLDASKAALTAAFMQKPEFVARYQATTSAESFTDALLSTTQHDAGIDLSSQRGALIAEYSKHSSLNQSRSAVLRLIVENEGFKATVYNHSFVLMQYFGYLQRDPEPEGLTFWYDVLNNLAPGNYRGIACGFITSVEYQRRFSSVVTRTNGECSR